MDYNQKPRFSRDTKAAALSLFQSFKISHSSLRVTLRKREYKSKNVTYFFPKAPLSFWERRVVLEAAGGNKSNDVVIMMIVKGRCYSTDCFSQNDWPVQRLFSQHCPLAWHLLLIIKPRLQGSYLRPFLWSLRLFPWQIPPPQAPVSPIWPRNLLGNIYRSSVSLLNNLRPAHGHDDHHPNLSWLLPQTT